jgi:hypothetical protein
MYRICQEIPFLREEENFFAILSGGKISHGCGSYRIAVKCSRRLARQNFSCPPGVTPANQS